jgi:UDP-glucose 4-epimerase
LKAEGTLRIIVFGAAGFVGRNLIEILSREDHEVVASDVVESPFGGTIRHLRVDLLDRNQVFESVKGCDIVVHLAASPLVVSLKDPLGNMRVNVEGTLNILDAARKHNVRKIIYSSASSVVGVPRYNPVDEDHPCAPKTPYAVAKKACEDYLRVYNEIYGLQYLVFRFFNLYGPWQTLKSGAIIPNVYKTLTEGKEFQVFGDGSNTRDFIYVGDVADFCRLAIKEDVESTVLNMGTGTGTSIIELINLGARLLRATPKITYKPPRPGEIGNFVADTRKLAEVFGNRVFTPLEDGLMKTFSWLGSQSS